MRALLAFPIKRQVFELSGNQMDALLLMHDIRDYKYS
jgi:hypothetical protein